MTMALCTKEETSSTRRRSLITTKQTARNLRIFCILLPSLLEKDVLSNSEDLFCSKHLVSFLVIWTGGTTFVCEVRLSFKYSNSGLTNFILNEVWWTAPSPKLKQRLTQEKKKKACVEAPAYYKTTCSEVPQTVNPQVSLPF